MTCLSLAKAVLLHVLLDYLRFALLDEQFEGVLKKKNIYKTRKEPGKP